MGWAFQLQTRLAPRRAHFVPPGDRPWAARSGGTHFGDVVASAFLQTRREGLPLTSGELRPGYTLLVEKWQF